MRVLKMLLVSAMVLALTSTAMAKDPYTAENNSWISLDGTVVSSGDSVFELDYGTGIVTVEMDDWDWYGEAAPLLEGDKVTVYGRVDDDLYELASIEASSVYVENLNTYFYASDIDEEDVVIPTRVTGTTGLNVQGIITDKIGREFTLDTGVKKVKVDTIEMGYNPLDDKGFQQLDKGDFVQVIGTLDVDFFEKAEIMADSVITLVKDSTKKNM